MRTTTVFRQTDDIAMEIAARSAALNVERQAPEELENVGVGYPPGPVRSAATTYTDYWTITTQSKHPDQAWRFLQFLMKPDILVAYNETMGFLPPRKSMLRHPYVARNRFNRVFMTSLLDGVSLPLPVTPLGRQAEFLLNDALATAVKQTTPPAGILQDAGRRANAFLRELWERLGERVE
jgi:ABC-type glycerol-3-phosphate transport system substrate-binding protein